MDLTEWASRYIVNLNSFRRNLLDKKVDSGLITCTYSDKGIVRFIIADILSDGTAGLAQERNSVIVCLNTKANVKFLGDNWSDFIRSQGLKMIFVNPDLNQQWSLFPAVHDRITEPQSLKAGLHSLFESIPEVDS